jgi:predicted lysophospholipase L1 biosynthesis ABC-type transport system permease subunit
VTGALRLALRYVPRALARGGRRAVVTLLCIAVGVAAIVALEVAALSVGDALTTNVRAANGGDISVSTNSAPLSSSDLAVLRQLAARGVVSRWTAVSRVHATAGTPGGRLVPFDAAVVDTSTYPVGGQPTFVTPAGGNVQQLLRRPGDVLVSAVLADELGAHAGSPLHVDGVGGTGLQATVRGVLAQASLEHAAVMYVRLADAGTLTSAPPQYVSVYANVNGDATSTAALLRQAFPQAGITTVAEAVASAQQQVHDFHTFALLSGLVALLVAGVGIQNAMQSSLASRITEVAMLKALGNPPAVVGGLFALEAAALGAAGGAVGTAVGIGVSSAVTAAVVRATGLAASAHVDPGVVLEGIGLGLGATVLFSLLPISGAVAVRPLGLMRGDLLPARRSVPRQLGLLLVVVALFALLAAYVTGDLQASVLLVSGGVAICGLLTLLFAAAVGALARLRRPAHTATAAGVTAVSVVAVAVVAPRAPALAPLALLALAVWVAAALGPQRWRLWLLMAGRSLDRRRTRSAVTIVALFAGALSAGLTMTMASALHGQITDAIASSGSTNLVAVATDPSRDALLRSATRLPGVQISQATVIAAGRATAIDGVPVAAAPAPNATDDPGEGRLRALNGLTGYALGSGDLPGSIRVSEGRPLGPADAGTTNVLVDRSLGGPPTSLHPGSTVTLADATTGNRVTVTVVGTYGRAGLRSQLTSRYSPRVLGDETAARSLAGGGVETVLSMSIAPAQLDADSVVLQRAVPSALVANVNDLTVVVRTVLDNLLLVLTVVTAMVVLAGIAVVANSVTLALIERAREVALLKSVGFGPGHVLTVVVLEHGLAGFLASAAGVVSIATALAILSRQVLDTPIAVSVGISAALVSASVVVTALTAWLAARSGASARPSTALRNS